MLKRILKWLMGPLTTLGTKYIEGKNTVERAKLKREVLRDYLTNEITKYALEDDTIRQQMTAAIIRRDRGDWKTAWIRPVTAGLALVFWIALTLSQIELGGNGLLPIIWNVPPGQLGNLFIAFPMGVLTTFYIARPIEKFMLGRQGV